MKMTLKVCSVCEEEKDIEHFYATKWGKHEAMCKPCRREYVKNRLKDPEVHAARLEYNNSYYKNNSEKINAQRRLRINTDLGARIKVCLANSKGNKKGLEYELDYEFMINLFNEQGGLCALSGETLEVTGDRYLSNMLSIDRIDSDRGYLKDNVQWVCVKYNMMKAHADMKTFIEMCRRVVEANPCD